MENNEEYDVALSFAGEDRVYVEKVAQLLLENGINVFYDDFNKTTLWGKNLIDHLGKVYSEQSRFIVMFISEHYVKKPWPDHERKFAQARALITGEDCVLPARFDDSEIPGLPLSVGYLDLRKTPPEELAIRIIEKVGRIRKAQNDGDDAEILFSDNDSLKPETHIYYVCPLEAGETIEFEVESKRPVDVLIFDNEDYDSWVEDGDGEVYSHYDYYKSYTILKKTFTSIESDVYMVVVVNHDEEKKTKVDVTIRRIRS